MNSNEVKKIKVQVEYNGLKHIAEGSVEEVIKEVISFLSKICPTYDVASKIIYTPDYLELLNNLSEIVNLTPNGELILLKQIPSTDEAIGILLLTVEVAYKLGKRQSNALSAEELTKILGKAEKTIRNTIAEMIKAGLIERIEKGTYHITAVGIKEVSEFIKMLKELPEDKQK
ncbi:MAG: type IV toxin-antitoxin system AbiEi family antitoxin domain-containing protein [Candidatus Bathyarchaeia archaeon]